MTALEVGGALALVVLILGIMADVMYGREEP